MPKKVTPVVKEVTAEPTDAKIINKWGASEAKWELDHEDEEITVTMRSGKEITGYLIGVDHYTITLDIKTNKIVIFKHAIDSMS